MWEGQGWRSAGSSGDYLPTALLGVVLQGREGRQMTWALMDRKCLVGFSFCAHVTVLLTSPAPQSLSEGWSLGQMELGGHLWWDKLLTGIPGPTAASLPLRPQSFDL